MSTRDVTESVGPDIDPALRRVAWAVIAGLAAPILDTTIVTIALARLGTDLHAPVSTVQWVSTGYLLALAVAVPISGWASARYGDRSAWVTGLSVFLIGSILCACAWDAPSLIAFRILQGLGAGLLFPLMTAILVAVGNGAPLGKVVAMVSMPVALGPILGPVLGGLVLTWLDWRWLFLINVPVCIVALVLAQRVPQRRDPARAHLDLVGLVLLAPGLAALLYGLSNAHNGIGRTDVLVPGLIGIGLMAAFVARGIVAQGPTLVDVRVLVQRRVASASVALFFFGVASYAAMFVLPLFFQEVRGASVLAAALLLIPQGIGALATRSVAGRLTDTIGPRWVAVAGFVVVAAGTVPFALAGAATNEVWLMAALVVRGLGLGALIAPILASPFIGLDNAHRHDVSMITRIMQQLGGSFGTAVLAVVITAGATMTSGFHAALWWAVALAVVGAAVSTLLPAQST